MRTAIAEIPRMKSMCTNADFGDRRAIRPSSLLMQPSPPQSPTRSRSDTVFLLDRGVLVERSGRELQSLVVGFVPLLRNDDDEGHIEGHHRHAVAGESSEIPGHEPDRDT